MSVKHWCHDKVSGIPEQKQRSPINIPGGHRKGAALQLQLTVFIILALDEVIGQHVQPLNLRDRAPVPFIQDVGWAFGPVWKVVNKISYADRVLNFGPSNS